MKIVDIVTDENGLSFAKTLGKNLEFMSTAEIDSRIGNSQEYFKYIPVSDNKFEMFIGKIGKMGMVGFTTTFTRKRNGGVGVKTSNPKIEGGI